MHRIVTPVVFVKLEHRKLRHPQRRCKLFAGINFSRRATSLRSAPREAATILAPARDDQTPHRPSLRLPRRPCAYDLFAQRFQQRRRKLFTELDPSERARAVTLDDLLQLVQYFARQLRAALDDNPFTSPPASSTARTARTSSPRPRARGLAVPSRSAGRACRCRSAASLQHMSGAGTDGQFRARRDGRRARTTLRSDL